MRMLKSRRGFVLPLIITIVPLVLALLIGIPTAFQIASNKWIVVMAVVIVLLRFLRK